MGVGILEYDEKPTENITDHASLWLLTYRTPPKYSLIVQDFPIKVNVHYKIEVATGHKTCSRKGIVYDMLIVRNIQMIHVNNL